MTKAPEKKKHITEVEDDEAMERLFSKKIVRELKKVAHEAQSLIKLTVDTRQLDRAIEALSSAQLSDDVLFGLLDLGDELFRIEPGVAVGASEIRFTLQPTKRLVDLLSTAGAVE